jgi:hypothetical protein
VVRDSPKVVVDIESLKEQMGNWIIPEHERAEPLDSDASEYEWQYESDEEDQVRNFCLIQFPPDGYLLV